MMKVTKDHIDHVYDAVTMMRLSAQILSNGDIDNVTAGEISWMLGSCKKRLEEVLELLEITETAQTRASELGIAGEITALEQKLADLRGSMKKGASA